MGTLKCLMDGGRSSSFLLNAASFSSIKQEYALQSGKSEGKTGSPIWIKRKRYISYSKKAENLHFLAVGDAMQILTSHVILCFSCKPIARAPLEISGIQKALTQLKGSITDHLEANYRSIHCMV
ncbi:hypothetical protein V8G54_023647 [Vigna mungo]|uniref:Uncharacterized protein n=1 Tax=Vigna mungo TaxID=3915 RepID=A0AAQ3N5R4_VIGMU